MFSVFVANSSTVRHQFEKAEGQIFGAAADPFGLSTQSLRFCVHYTLRMVYSRQDKHRGWLLQSSEPHPRNDMQRRLIESRKSVPFLIDFI